MKKISTLAIALIAMGSLATPVSAQNIMPKASTEGGATYTYYLKGASSYTTSFYFKNEAQGSDQVQSTNQTDNRLKVKLVASGDKYNIIATNLSSDNTKTYLGCTGTGKEANVTFYTAEGKTNADWTIAKGGAKSGDMKFMNQYYPYFKLCPGGTSSVNMVGGAAANKVIKLWDADDQGSQWNFIPADVATLLAWADDAKAEIDAITTTASKDDVLTAIQAAQSATEADVDAKAAALLSAYTSFFKQVKLATITDFEKDYNAHKGQAGYATEASFAAYEAKVQSVTTGTYDQIASAASAAASTITEVNMPADGKVYVFTNVQKNGARYYLKYVNDNLKAFERGEESAENLDDAAKFVCRVVDGKYVFVNVKDGKYLIYKTENSQYGNGDNSGKGYIDTYAADYADLSVSKHSTYPCLNIIGKRSDSFPTSYFILNAKDGSYNAYNQEGYTDSYSTAFLFEEVSYPNTITFNTVSDVEGVKSIATFSAPFATVIPEGVTAYYVSTADNRTATMKAITGKAIPAKTGVILTSQSGDAVTMVPATNETIATIENNKLGNSAGAEKTIAADDHAYILSAVDGQTAFYKGKVNTILGMNKAYLTLNEAGAPEAISMNFGGNVTGINQIVNAEQNNAPVYDLTGRRVVRTVKGGLYIKGGNKFIAR